MKNTLSDRYEDPKVLGNFLKILRLENGYTRRQVADRLGLKSGSSVMYYEIGKTTGMRHVIKLAELFSENLSMGISPSVLLAMFEANSTTVPCRCYCHYDLKNAITNIYNDDRSCRLCGHGETDCEIVNGLWFESS